MTPTAYASPTPTGRTSASFFPTVCAEELAFALSIFVAAANGTLAAGSRQKPRPRREQAAERDQLFTDLTVHGAGSSDRVNAGSPYGSLNSAFAALWSEYRNHESRDSICARVLCFYLLMERTEGRAVSQWTSSCPDRPEEVTLDPAVVQGLADVPLEAETKLSEARLLAAVGQAHQIRRAM